MQQTLDFEQKRRIIKRTLKGAELAVYETLRDFPALRSIKKRNALIRRVWNAYGDYPAESITRHARKFQARGEFDCEENQDERANVETAYRNYFQWPQPSALNPKPASPIDSTTTTLVFTSAPKDEDGNVITEDSIVEVRGDDGFMEWYYLPADSM